MTPGGRRWLWLLGWTLAAALIYVLARGVDYGTLVAALRRADWRLLAIAMLAYATLQPVGALQWRSLMPRGAVISERRMLTLFSLTSLANNTTPSIVGHAAGAALLGAEPGVGPAAALSVIALDQLAVGLSKLVVLAAAIGMLGAPGWLRTGAVSLLVAVLLLAAALVVAAVQAERLRAWGDAHRANRVVGAVLGFAGRWAGHLDALREPRRLAAGVACALLARALELMAIVAVQHAMGLNHGVTGSLAVLAGTSLATVIPFSPAGLGTYEAGVYGAYRFLAHTPETALAVAVVQHACLLVPAVGIGYLTLTVRRRV